MIKNSTIKQWMKERDAVVKTYDVELFKVFYEKWKKKGIYSMKLPPDKVIEISMRKMVCNMASSTDEQKEEAMEWLEQHGSSPNMF